MRLYIRSPKKLISVAFLSFVLGYMLCFVYNVDNKLFTHENAQEYDVIILIISSPNNFRQRNTIRRTWLKLMDEIDYNLFETTLQYMTVPSFNKQGFIVKDSINAQRDRLTKYKSKIDNRSYKQKNDKEHKRKVFKIKYLFSVGIKDLYFDTLSNIMLENTKHDDMLLLSSFKDSYESLTTKVIESFTAISKYFKYKYIMKCDDDSYIRLNNIIEELQAFDDNLIANFHNRSIGPQLYWGYFNGAARVKHSGSWAETEWFMCDRYLPYALGGGYVLSHALVKYIIDNADILSQYRSEDVSIGAWLAPLRNVYRRHDPRFNTEWKPRQFNPLHIILHKIKPEVMDQIWAESNTGKVENSSIDNLGYFYNWDAHPSRCCT